MRGFLTAIIFLLLWTGSSLSEPKLTSLGIIKGSAIDYIPSDLKINDAFYVSTAFFAGALYIVKKGNGYHNYYVSAEEKGAKSLLKRAKQVCSKSADNSFYLIDNFEVKTTNVGDGNLLIVVSGNAVCLGFR